MSTAVKIRDPKTFVPQDVWARQVKLIMRDPEISQDKAERIFGQTIAYFVTAGENSDLIVGPSLEVDQGVDVAPSREATAHERWGHLPGLDFRTAEAVDYLTTEAATFDVVLSIFGAVWFVDPDELLPLVGTRMTEGGILAFSHLPAGSQELKPGRAGMRHDHAPDEWTRLLHRYGLTDVRAEIIEPPAGQSAATMLIRATV
ncbi:class I SAM-dependent methyltransferase [Streptomyces sp. NPDC102381]|uniref:class I SAM-dependent methyltransferase n=1 Tax=Streptomyces sp. NPDC102381 TaxID=3366164 RepID=UPI0037F8281E